MGMFPKEYGREGVSHTEAAYFEKVEKQSMEMIERAHKACDRRAAGQYRQYYHQRTAEMLPKKPCLKRNVYFDGNLMVPKSTDSTEQRKRIQISSDDVEIIVYRIHDAKQAEFDESKDRILHIKADQCDPDEECLGTAPEGPVLSATNDKVAVNEYLQAQADHGIRIESLPAASNRLTKFEPPVPNDQPPEDNKTRGDWEVLEHFNKRQRTGTGAVNPIIPRMLAVDETDPANSNAYKMHEMGVKELLVDRVQ